MPQSKEKIVVVFNRRLYPKSEEVKENQEVVEEKEAGEEEEVEGDENLERTSLFFFTCFLWKDVKESLSLSHSFLLFLLIRFKRVKVIYVPFFRHEEVFLSVSLISLRFVF